MDLEQKQEIVDLEQAQYDGELTFNQDEVITLAQQEDPSELLNLDLISNPPISLKNEEQKSTDEAFSNGHVGLVPKISLADTGSLTQVDSVARDLSILAPGPKLAESTALDFTLNVVTLPAIRAIDNQYNLNKIGHKVIHEITHNVDFNLMPEGSIIDSNNWLVDNTSITVLNSGLGPDKATVINSNNVNNGEQNLQAPWSKGNIQNEVTGHILIIADNDIDSNHDGLIDHPLPEGANPSGILTFKFDTPAYEFGWDIFNLEYGPEVQASEIIFYDKHGRNTTVPFESFLEPDSPFYDSTISLGSHSANRISPIKVEDLELSEIIKVKMVVAEEVGVSHFTWEAQQTELKSNQIHANLLDNDVLYGQVVNIQNIRFSFESEAAANQYISDNPALSTSLHGSQVWIHSFNQDIPTPLGGNLKIQANGDFLYTVSDEYSKGEQSEIFTYEIQSANGQSSQADVIINLHDNVPVANNVDNFAQAGNGVHNYNLMLVLDVSGSMGAEIYNHTRLELAQDALIQLIDKYDLISDNLNITVMPFASNEGLDGAFGYRATSIDDAKDFILRKNAHQVDGIKIQMINPDTGEALGRSTHYDTALYHARENLEQDITNPDLNNFQHTVYFISDGVANTGHSALDQGNWPDEWGSWHDFIQNTTSEVPTAQVANIDVFAVGIDANESLLEPLEPIASKPENIIEPDSQLFTFSQQLLGTLPEMLEGNVLVNDLYWANEGLVTKISFIVENAQDFIAIHQLNNIGATVSNNNHTVNIPLPDDGSIITIPTPTDGKLILDNGGNYQYVPSFVESQHNEIFTYTLFDKATKISKEANLTIHLYSDDNGAEQLLGNHHNDLLSTEGLSGAIYIESGRGDDNIVIDFMNQSVSSIYINDLLSAQQNQLHFKNVFDTNFDGQINIQDVFSSFEQNQENANVVVQLNNANIGANFSGTELIFENIGTIPGPQVSDLIEHLDNMTSVLDVI
tara:strand:- start:205713 stop:208631 length:2919 start_codon:yes stop_codon:yes gene_type:complete